MGCKSKQKMIEDTLITPLFGTLLTILSFYIATAISRRLRWAIANPLLIATLISLGVMRLFDISYSEYMIGGEFIDMFIGPATALLGMNIYHQRKILGDNFIPIISGSIGGSICSIGSTYILCHLLDINNTILLSLLPKSVTTAIAMDLSAILGGDRSITALCVIMCGIFGAILNPLLVRVLNINNSIATGVGMGTSSHAIGSAKALEMGKIEGAVSSVSMCITGIFTVLLLAFW